MPEDPNELEKETRALRSLVRPAVAATSKGLEHIGLTPWDKGETEMWELSGAAMLYEAGGQLSGVGMFAATACFIGGSKVLEYLELKKRQRAAAATKGASSSMNTGEQFRGELSRVEPVPPKAS